jgi:endonuclease G
MISGGAGMIIELGEQERQHDAALRRVKDRTPERNEHEAVLAEPGGLAAADTPERIAKRIDRLSMVQGEDLPVQADDPGELLEKIINTEDFVGVRYLEAGVAAARAVGRVDIRDARGRQAGFGTGSMVSPVLLLTNHHVLPDLETARASAVEFDFQDGVDGRPLPVTVLPFDPDLFFVADQRLDFALVAVRATPADLAPFGFSRLIEAQGTVILGEFVTIVQHPRGEKKQVALRENRIIDLPEQFVHYEADTEPGSSGSPVFNDQWEIVALHHASVPAPDHAELGGFVNEGIRISHICRFLRDAQLPPQQRTLADQIFTADRPELTRPAGIAPPALPLELDNRELTVSVPLQVTVRLGDLAPPTTEAITIDPDYAGRGGYDPVHLGQPLPLPVPPPELAAVVSPELRYHHFSVVMHRARRLALFTACNIDGKQAQRPRRESDRWILDPRIPADQQTGEAVYRANGLDRGHLVRRLDPAWGGSLISVKAANDDTFHFTNATPQHHEFNAGHTLWAGLEDYVLGNADDNDLAVTVLTGAVLAPDDDVYRGVQLPRQFWKILAMVKPSGELSVTAYLLSQATLIADLPGNEDFSYGAYRTYQVPVSRIAALTGLDLTPYTAADPLGHLEAAPLPREVVDPEDLRF